MNIDIDKFWQDGFLMLRGVLAPEKVARWRAAGLKATAGQDLLSNDTLAEVICEPVLVESARQILGGDPIYFGDSTVLCGTSAGSGFHKDNSDRLDAKAPDWQVQRYPIIRFGIYTEPHGKLPYGLDLRAGSHNHSDFTSGEMVSATVKPGDLIVWNGRTTHSGNSQIFKLTGHRLEPDPTSFFFRALNKLGGMPWLFAKHPQERVAIFASYALASTSLDRHIDYLRQREYAVEHWKNSSWNATTRKKAEDIGLGLLDVTNFKHDGRKLHRLYHAIPYQSVMK